jgi:Fe-S-cluster containining protein
LSIEQEIIKNGYKPVKPDDSFSYKCARCGRCCRDVKNAVMLESLDLFRLARFLKMPVENVALTYTNTAFLSWWHPLLLLKTTPHRDTCVFLTASGCSVHAANPRACRTYPLGVGPNDERPGEWLQFIVSKKYGHFNGPAIRVGDWMDKTFTQADREFVAADYEDTGILAGLAQRIDRRHEEQIAELVLYYKYLAYDNAADFMPQYKRNIAELKARLERLGGQPR